MAESEPQHPGGGAGLAAEATAQRMYEAYKEAIGGRNESGHQMATWEAMHSLFKAGWLVALQVAGEVGTAIPGPPPPEPLEPTPETAADTRSSSRSRQRGE